VSQLFQPRPGPLYLRQQPVRDRRYLAFIRRLPCIGCGRQRGIEAMHTGPHGLGQKASDLNALPGCRQCHRELHQIGPVRFQERHTVNFQQWVETLNARYQRIFHKEAA